MEQRTVGELSVSVIGLGCNQLGTAACDEATGEQIVHEALEAGITFFDTSDEYGRDYANLTDPTGWGRSEEILGRALKAHRADVVIATKFGPTGGVEFGTGDGDPLTDRSRANARGIRLAVEESLQRLATDYIDLYQLHWPDPRTPVDETLAVLDELIREGKVREIGCCNFTGPEFRASVAAASAQNVRPFVSVQSELNVLRRAALADVLPACEELGASFIPYYPLASGVLSGKYRRGEAPPAGSRLSEQVGEEARRRILSDRNFARLDVLEAFAGDHGRTMLDLAFAWLLGLPPVATVIAGASRVGQATANSHAAGWHLTPAQVAEVTAAVAAVG
ncbi:MAG: aldo/keto reductase [Acidimicrobiia bacterium]|nr:aldo/keto reductase [Acidimicrobiia bacterium]